MQAIVVRYIGPSNTRGSRMSVRAGKGIKPLSRGYDSGLNVEANAICAASDFIKRQGWFPNVEPGATYGAFWTMGTLPNGDYVFVNCLAEPWRDMDAIDTRAW